MRRKTQQQRSGRRLSFDGVASAAGSLPVGLALWVLAAVAVLWVGLDHRFTTPGIDLATRLQELQPLLRWESPYPEFIYPPLSAWVMLPIAHAPVLSVVWTLALLAAVPLALWWFGVRDWRCYLAATVWPPVVQAVSSGNVTLFLLLAAAAVWRWRGSTIAAGCAGGLAIALKLIAWPLAVWLAATGRGRSSVLALVGAVTVSFVLWAPLAFGGLLDYPSTLRELDARFASDGYSIEHVLQRLGAPHGLASIAPVVLAALLMTAVWILGRKRREAEAFALALLALTYATPIAWLHSFALLLGAIAVLRPKFSVVWLAPLLLYFVVESGNGYWSERQLYLTLAIMGATLLGAFIWPRPRDNDRSLSRA